MTKLEEEIFHAIWETRYSSDPASGARAATEVAKKYINCALESCGILVNRLQHDGTHGNWAHVKDKWLAENGVIE